MRRRKRITEPAVSAWFRPKKISQQIVSCAHRHLQMTIITMLLVHIQQALGNERCADQVWLASRHQSRARLPRKAIAPAPEFFLWRAQSFNPCAKLLCQFLVSDQRQLSQLQNSRE